MSTFSKTVQQRLDQDPPGHAPPARETVEQPFGTFKMRMGTTHFLMKTLPTVASEMASQRTRLQSDARLEYRRYNGVAGGDQGVSVQPPLRADLEPEPTQHPPR
jgi:hypothetical protein